MSFSSAYSLKNNEVTLTNCDREPVHVPGCIQSHGVLVALDADLTIRHVSLNCADWLGLPADRLLGRNWAELAPGAWDVALQSPDVLPRYALTLSDFDGRALPRPLDIIVHAYNGLTVIEGEAVDPDSVLPLERAYGEVNRMAGRLQRSTGLQDFCDRLCADIRELTGLDRVMVYRFHEDLSGEVYAEAKRDDLHPYLTLRYPSEDIPAPAREIFRKIWVRPVPDVHAASVEITPLLHPVSGQPLDMTYCALRGASVMYTDYLKNMGVAAAFTLSILVDGKLWGLVACHHYAPKHIPWPVRAACELLAQIASLQLKAAEQADFAQYHARLQDTSRQLVDFMTTTEQPLNSLLHSTPNLLDFITASGVAVSEGGVWSKTGLTPRDRELDELGAWLQETWQSALAGTEILHTNALDSRFKPASLYRDKASGLLAIPVSRNARDMIPPFLSEVTPTINPARDPHSKILVDGPGGQRLTPRASFASWQETVAGQSMPWQPAEIDTARRLRLSLTEIIASRVENVSRLNKELAVSNAELDSFAYVTSHDLREPLRGIHHYAHFLHQHARERQDEKSIVQSDHLLRLTRRMDGLIESLLHFSRVGRTSLDHKTVDMRELAQEAVDILRASRPEKKPLVTIADDLPPVVGDRVRLREVWLNLLTNAVKYNDSDTPAISIGMRDTVHCPAYFIQDDGIGIAPAFHERIFEMFKRLHGKDKYGGGSGAGLPIVKKIIERHGGVVWLESPPGLHHEADGDTKGDASGNAKGTIFYFSMGNDT